MSFQNHNVLVNIFSNYSKSKSSYKAIISPHKTSRLARIKSLSSYGLDFDAFLTFLDLISFGYLDFLGRETTQDSFKIS